MGCLYIDYAPEEFVASFVWCLIKKKKKSVAFSPRLFSDATEMINWTLTTVFLIDNVNIVLICQCNLKSFL